MDIKLYHGGAEGYSRGSVFATPIRRIAEGYALLNCYFHRKMGAKTKAIVETGTGTVGWLDKAHASSYLMAEWNVLAEDEISIARVSSKSDVYITSFCGDDECQHYLTCHRVEEAKLAFVYCLCNEADSPVLDRTTSPPMSFLG